MIEGLTPTPPGRTRNLIVQSPLAPLQYEFPQACYAAGQMTHWLAVVRQFAIFIIAFVSLAAVFGCSEPPASPATTRKAGIQVLPVEFKVRQRSSTPVPGSDGRLLITIDDITRNQVIVTAATTDGASVLPSRSMSPQSTAPLNFDGQRLLLRLQRLDNALAGEDFAGFEISADDGSLTEKQKIERLIQEIAALSGATFIRNDGEHSAAEAAEHLRSKWNAAGERIATAQQFIDHVASRSSASGKPYQIRLADGRVIDSADFLREKLGQFEHGR
jgi:hypothetical protein